MKILVTGGAGFVGSSVCLRLKEKYPNYEFTAFDNLKRSGSEVNLSDLKKAGIKFVHGDIRCKEDLEPLKGFDTVIEASAEPSVMAGLDSNPTYVINNNLSGAINCFNLCLEQNANLIFLSTSRVYPISRIESANYSENEVRFSFSDIQSEKGISSLGISEDLSLIGARSFYGTTKLAAEFLIEEYATFYGLNAAITRFGVIAGPRQMGKTDQGVVTLWMAKHYFKKSLQYIGYGGTGKQVRDVLHIDDLVDLIELQIHHPELFNGHVYNAGGGVKNSTSLLEMTNMCEKISGNKIFIEPIVKNRPADLKCFITDNTRISNAIGWEPKRTMEKIFSDIFKWIRQNEKQLKEIF